MESLAAPPRAGVARNGNVLLSWRAHGHGEPILMIMGLALSSRAWFRMMPRLAAARTCVVFDNRGTGDSDRPGGLWSMADLAADAVAVMDAAGLESAHVLGASMGGMIAQQVALADPDRVRSLVLCCTSAHSGGAPNLRLATATALRPVLSPKHAFSLVAPALYGRETREHGRERMAEDLSMRVQDPTPPSSVFRQIGAVRGHDVRSRLGEIQAPTLVLHGDDDRIIPADRGRELASRIPGARLVLLPGAGHMLSTDAEEETVSAVKSFLEEVES